MVKPAYGSPIDRETYMATLGIFERLMCILHPFMPFVTEEIWHTLKERCESATIMLQHMPQSVFYDQRMLDDFANTQEVIAGVRGTRNTKGLSPKETLDLYVRGEHASRFNGLIKKLANVGKIESTSEKMEGTTSFMVGTTEYYIPMSQNIDVAAEREKLEADLKYMEGFLNSVMKKLSNEKFVNGAPEKVVNVERQKKADAEQKIEALKAQLAALGN
jgi:valyl-tRNA synthetase